MIHHLHQAYAFFAVSSDLYLGEMWDVMLSSFRESNFFFEVTCNSCVVGLFDEVMNSM